eukprot:6805495-Pyramimonas_sp.AAC.1
MDAPPALAPPHLRCDLACARAASELAHFLAAGSWAQTLSTSLGQIDFSAVIRPDCAGFTDGSNVLRRSPLRSAARRAQPTAAIAAAQEVARSFSQ